MRGASSAAGPLNNVPPYSSIYTETSAFNCDKAPPTIVLYLLSLVHVDFEFVGFVAQWWCHDALHTMSRVLF